MVTVAPGQKREMRRRWLLVHRWIGLTAGLLFVLLGLTGSILVFDHAIDEWLHPDLLLTKGQGARRPLADVISAAERAFADSSVPAHSVTRPRVAHGVWTVWFVSERAQQPVFTAVHVDPYTSEVTGQRVWGEDPLSWIYRLHFRLLAGATGATIVGVAGIVMMVSIISGVWLWWPLWKNGWRSAFAIRRGRRFTYDFHKTAGILSSLLLLVIAFTGVTMEFHDWCRQAVSWFSELTEPVEGLESHPTSDASPLTPDEAIAIAREVFPGATFDHLHPPEGADGVYEVAFRQPDEVQQAFGRSQVFLDQYRGDVLTLRDPADFTAGDAFLAWQFPLHNGEAFGLVGRWVVCATGLVPALLYLTGLILWLRRRQPAMQGRRAATETTADARPEQPVAP